MWLPSDKELMRPGCFSVRNQKLKVRDDESMVEIDQHWKYLLVIWGGNC